MTRNPFLQVKIISLADEARTIRRKERRFKHLLNHAKTDEEIAERSGYFYTLRQHRKFVVRPEARASLVAYGYLNGLSYRHMENSQTGVHGTNLDWGRVKDLVKKYGTSAQLVGFDRWAKEAEEPIKITA